MVLEMDGGQTVLASDRQERALWGCDMWIDGLTRTQAWWIHQTSRVGIAHLGAPV